MYSLSAKTLFFAEYKLVASNAKISITLLATVSRIPLDMFSSRFEVDNDMTLLSLVIFALILLVTLLHLYLMQFAFYITYGMAHIIDDSLQATDKTLTLGNYVFERSWKTLHVYTIQATPPQNIGGC